MFAFMSYIRHWTLSVVIYIQNVWVVRRNQILLLVLKMRSWFGKVMYWDLTHPRNTVFFYVGLHFCLCGGQEQKDLSFKQFPRVPKDTGVYNEDTYFEYTEFISKNYQHRFIDIHAKNKTVKAYAVGESDKCLVKILDWYISKVPQKPKAFYLCPLDFIPSDPFKTWFANTPVGVNTLRNVVSNMCKQADVAKKYTNHSLQATATSRKLLKMSLKR